MRKGEFNIAGIRSGTQSRRFCFPLYQNMIQRKPIVVSRRPENKQQERETRNDVKAEVEERLSQQMTEGYDDQNETERDERVARAQTEDDERAGNELDEGNSDANGPERPDRQEGVGEGQKIFSRVL